MFGDKLTRMDMVEFDERVEIGLLEVLFIDF